MASVIGIGTDHSFTTNEENDDIIEILQKPVVSKLRAKISHLNGNERKSLVESVKDLYERFLSGKSDDFPGKLDEFKKPVVEVYSYPPKEVRAKVFDRYHNRNLVIAKILGEVGLDVFDFIAALCNCIWTMSGGCSIDLTRAIQFRHITEYQVILLVDLILQTPKITRLEIIMALSILPSDALLLLTLVWSELELPTLASKFEPYLSCPSPTNYTQDYYEQCDKEFQSILKRHLDSYEEPEIYDVECRSTLEGDLKKSTSELGSYSKILEGIKGINQIFGKVPPLYLETVVSDSSDSGQNVESDSEMPICIKRGFTAKWICGELAQSNLEEELRLEEDGFCFAPVVRLFADDPTAAQCQTGFAKCMIRRKLADGYFELQSLNKPDHLFVSRSELAIGDAPSIRCPEGTRVVALCEKTEQQTVVKYFSGTIGVKPMPNNRFEYLVFFDNGIDAYVKPPDIRLLVDQPTDPTGKFFPRYAYTKVENKNPQKAKFMKQYFAAYPDWPLIQLKKLENTQRILAIRGGLRESAFVLDVDRHLSLLRFPGIHKMSWQMGATTKNVGKDCVNTKCHEHEHIDEWIYRGNPDRFPTLAERFPTLAQVQNTSNTQSQLPQNRTGRFLSRHTARKFPSNHFEMACPQQNMSSGNLSTLYKSFEDFRLKQTARKRSSKCPAIGFESVMQLPIQENQLLLQQKKLSEQMKNEILTVPKYANHPKHRPNMPCSSNCLQNVSTRKLLDNLYKIRSPYLTPLLCGWTRMKIHSEGVVKKNGYKSKRVQYRAPCGIRLNAIEQIADYLHKTGQPELTIDMFSFDPQVRPEVVAKTPNEESIKMEDFTKGGEAVPISMVNSIDNAVVDPNFVYRPRRTGIKRKQQMEATPVEIVEKSIDPSFCTGCSCVDDCRSNERCECRKLTAVAHDRLSESLQIHKSHVRGYNYRQLDDKLISGIYECNSKCKCNQKLCFNRVVQQDLKIPLQLFMTAEKGWGVRTLVDIPEGTFVCTYSGEILDEDVAETQGRENGDIYLADLDLIKVVEDEKRNQGIDLISDEGIEEGEFDEEERQTHQTNQESTSYHLAEDEAYHEPISARAMYGAFDDEQLLLPSAIDEMILSERTDSSLNQKMQPSETNKWKNKVERRNSSRKPKVPPMKLDDYFGVDFLFIVDAAKTGNIGRFLNHSCDPNCHIQHCLVDTHDLRMPWCAFFTKKFVHAGDELCWDYAYEIGAVKKQVVCKCGSSVCRGRML